MKKNNKDSVPSALSRRGFLRTSALGAAGGAMLLGTSRSAQAAESGSSLLELSKTVVGLKQQQPDLPGLASLNEFVANAYPRALSREDADILNGALYLNAARMLGLTGGYPGADSVAPALEQPMPVERLGQEFFTSTLKETKERMATDGAFAESVRWASGEVRKLDIESGNPPHDEPAAFIIIIIIIIIIILVCWPTKAH